MNPMARLPATVAVAMGSLNGMQSKPLVMMPMPLVKMVIVTRIVVMKMRMTKCGGLGWLKTKMVT